VIKEMRDHISGLQSQLKTEIRNRSQAEMTFSANLSATKKDLQLQIDEMQKSQNDLVAEVKRLARSLAREKEDREMLEVKHGELQNEVETLKAHLSELDFFATNELQKALHMIELRGNIQVNFDTGDVRLLRPINFQPRTTKDTPSAVFTQADVASAICRDLAEVMKLFDCPIEVEGHTKGGEGEFWQTLANERARVVVEKMVEFGAAAGKISSRGKPGTLGLNETRTIVHMILPAESRDQAVRRRSSLISLG
jgi:outer membrane protein OmpA-like peptidoglycan-associated protein